MKYPSFVIIILSLLLNLGFFTAVMAAEEIGLKMQPSIIEEKAEPGQSQSMILHVTNMGVKEESYFAAVRDIISLAGDGQPIFAKVGEKTGYDVSSWIEITKDKIVIQGGETKDIPFTITVPKDASPGGHFGAIFFVVEADQLKEIGSGIGYQVGTIVNLRVAGNIQEDAQIREFNVDRGIYEKPRIEFSTRLENLGNSALRIRGPIEITNMFGKKIGGVVMNDGGAVVLPRSERSFTVEWLGEGTAFGKYDAVMSLSYGDEVKKTIVSSVSFWVLPKKIVLAVLASIFGVVLVFYIFTKLYIRKKLRELK